MEVSAVGAGRLLGMIARPGYAPWALFFGLGWPVAALIVDARAWMLVEAALELVCA
jgi:hypothetical protein